MVTSCVGSQNKLNVSATSGGNSPHAELLFLFNNQDLDFKDPLFVVINKVYSVVAEHGSHLACRDRILDVRSEISWSVSSRIFKMFSSRACVVFFFHLEQ